MGNVVADLVVDKTFDDILLMSPHDDAAHMSVIGLGKEISWVRRVATVFQGYQVVLLIASHVVGVRHAPSRIDLSRAGVDKFRPCLVDSIPVFPQLFPLQLARVSRGGSYQLRASLAVADVVPNFLLRDLRVRSPWSPHGVGVDFRRTDAVGLRLRPVRQKDADQSHGNGERDLGFHLAGSL